MNKDRILLLADHVEKQPHKQPTDRHGFSMARYKNSCGSPACIAGHAAAIANGTETDEALAGDAFKIAATWLGIQSRTASALFLPAVNSAFNNITPAQAAIVLRKFAETGFVDWSFVDAEQEAF